MGSRRTCDAPVLPIRPDSEICLYNGDGYLACFDPRGNPQKYKRPIVIGDIAVNSRDAKNQDEWMYSVLKACR